MQPPSSAAGGGTTTPTSANLTPSNNNNKKKTKTKNLKERRSSSDLAAVSDAASSYEEDEKATAAAASLSSWQPSIPSASALEEFLFPVLSTALLITSNTVGASMLVLPELAAAPGMAISTAVLVAAYLLNWMSGLCIAQVAIQQYEDSGQEVPSSFKEFAQEAQWMESASTVVSGISIFVNALVLAFDTTKAGQVLQGIVSTGTTGSTDGMSVSAMTMTMAWTVLMLGIVSTQSLTRLSQIASLLVVGVFVSFAGILLPGLAQVADPMAVLTSGPLPGQELHVLDSVLHMAPVFVTTLVYQNIVPTVTRLLGYDRTKVVTAISLGSFVPLCIYVAWCVAVLGGGIGGATTSSAAGGGALFALFSMVTVAGSSMGALMSLAEEFETLLLSNANPETGTSSEAKGDTFSWPSVALPSLLALGTCQFFADDISGALKVAGSFGSPLLYGLIPVAMAYSQQQRKQQQQQQGPLNTNAISHAADVLPGGMAGLGALGLGASALVGSELAATVSQAMVGS